MKHSTPRLGAVLTASLLLSLSPQLAQAQQMQMLPPTYAGSSTVCAANNSVLFFSGSTGTDTTNGRPISAINCLGSDPIAPTIDPTTGDLWVGSTNTSGNLWNGFAEAAPIPKLHISSTTGTNSDDFYFQRADIYKDQSVLRLVMGDNWGTAPFYPMPVSGSTTDAFQIGALDASNSYTWHPLFTFTGNGALGIGTASPVAQLQISGGNILLDNAQNVAFVTPSYPAGIEAMRMTGNDLFLGSTEMTGGTIGFYNNGHKSVMIDSSGNVGIGSAFLTSTDVAAGLGTATFSPQWPLHIYDHSAFIELSVPGKNSGDEAALNFQTDSTTGGDLGDLNTLGWQIAAAGNNSGVNGMFANELMIHHWNGGAWDCPFIFLTNGYVGIGTTPTQGLEVTGNILAWGTVTQNSDRRLKKDIQPLESGALDAIQKLKPVTFQWKTPKPGMEGKQIGFIAQDVQTVIPDLILMANNKDKTLSLKYDQLIPILTKAMQELKADNDKLHADFEDYKAKHP